MRIGNLRISKSRREPPGLFNFWGKSATIDRLGSRRIRHPGFVKVQRQHVVSQVLLRGWADNGMLRAIKLRYGSAKLRSPKAEGFVPWYVVSDYSHVIEALWKEVEDLTPAAVASVRDGSIFGKPDEIDVLRRLFATHCVRAKSTRLSWSESLARQMQDGHLANIIEMARDDGVLAALYEHQTGLVATSPVQLERALDQLIADLGGKFDAGGEAFVEQMLELYDKVLDFVRTRGGIEIGQTNGSALIIGDNPAAAYDAVRRKAGSRDGVNIQTATNLVMPLTPTHVLAVGGANRFVPLEQPHIDLFNQIQIVCAVDSVYVQPSATDLKSWVLREREAFMRGDDASADVTS